MGPSASVDDGCVLEWCLWATSGQPLGTGADQWSAGHARGADILDHAWVTVDSVRFL